MMPIDRRSFLTTSSAGLAGGLLLSHQTDGAEASVRPGDLHLARFRFDVTPPLGHSLCSGWIKPVEAIDDPLEAIGLVILGAGEPIVICSVDWTGLLNEAHVQWRVALAEAAGTSPQRVAVQCVHQHNAPFACLEAERIVDAQTNLPHIVDMDFFRNCLDAARAAVAESLRHSQPVTAVAHGSAAVDRVAANRRILGPNGKVVSQRGSSSANPEHHRLPEGLIDPQLKTIAFYNGEQKVAACHYYACHPMSYYGDGRVSADFCGLARKQRQLEEPDCTHLYFNGCGGNIGAGKYNDGSPAMRPVLTRRIYDGIVASEVNLEPQPIESLKWVTHELLPPPDARWNEDEIMRQIEKSANPVVARNRPAYTVAWIRRYRQQVPITLSALHINNASMLHLPAECFIEYQLGAQAAAAERFVACAAYGDGGPWYIPTAEAYGQGGYEASVAWCDPQIEMLLSQGIRSLLASASESASRS